MMRIQVLASEHKEGIAKKTGNAYSMDTAQAVCHSDDPAIPPFVGELTIPKGHEPLKPGFYTPSFRVRRTPEGKMVADFVKFVLTGSPVKAA